jgi:hypothetical protein
MSKRLGRALVCSFAAFALAGCLVEGTIDEKGGATVDVNYRIGKGSQLEAERKRMESPAVKVLSASISDDNHAKFSLKTEDVTKLSTARFFEEAAITLADGEEGTKVLAVKITRKNPMKLPDEALAYFGKEVKIALILPGDIVKSNATKTDGKTATWTYEMNEFMNTRETVLDVTYKKAAEEKPAEEAPAEKKEEKKN